MGTRRSAGGDAKSADASLALGSRHGIADKQKKTARRGAEADETNIAHIESAAQGLELMQENQQDKQSFQAGDHLKLFRRTKILTVHLECLNNRWRYLGSLCVFRDQLDSEVLYNFHVSKLA